MAKGLLGMIATPKQGNSVPPEVTWCADNGAYGKGYPGDDAWFAWLASYDTEQRARCAFAVAPDVPVVAGPTLERSRPWFAPIRSLGYRAAFVAQNGLEHLEVPWDEFDVLFIGGDTAWKLGPAARTLATEAKTRGKRVHMGRVNSERRYRYALAIGCDSVDGTYLTFGPDKNLPAVLAWSRASDQYAFPGGAS